MALWGTLPGPFFPSGVQSGSHRPLCEAVGRRPLSPAVFGYPSDIQLFLRQEAHFWQLLDLDSRKLCLTPFLFVSKQPVCLYHFPLGCVSPPAALSLSLSLARCHFHSTPSSPPAREEDVGKRQGEGHVSRHLCCPQRPKWQLGWAPKCPGMRVLPWTWAPRVSSLTRDP